MYEVCDYSEKDLARFWSHVDKTGGEDSCWLWSAKRHEHGYGQVWWNKHMLRAHRVSWVLANGEIPEGLHVLHNCPDGDNPACVNPAHLWIGTHKQNMEDRNAKGRQGGAFGEKNGMNTHPESVLSGDQHWSRISPEKMARGELAGPAKLTEKQALEILERYSLGGITQEELGKKYSVTKGAVGHIIRGLNWKHLRRTEGSGNGSIMRD